MMINVGFLLSDIAYGGAAISAYHLIKNLDKSKYNVHIFVNNFIQEEFAEDFKKHCVSLNKVSLPVIQSFSKCQKNTSNLKALFFHQLYRSRINTFIELLKAITINILHINTTLFAYIPPIVKSELGIKVVFHVREVITKKKTFTFKLENKWISNFSDIIICISENEAIPFGQSDKVFVIPNPFDFNVINLHKDINRNDAKYIGMLGVLSHVKRADLFLKAVNIIMKKYPDFPFKFVILGAYERGPYWKLFAKILIYKRWYELYYYLLFDLLKMKDKVIFIERTTNILSFFNQLLIYVRPSGHPWGRDIIEAMAYGVPVVANGTSDFYIKHNISGLLAKPNDAEDLAKKIYYLACDEKLREKFVINAKYQIKEQCDVFKHVATIENIYDGI
jgi:glycosyltransferase involved in cell wall biosynthesis